jgi:hypothetical protein
MASTKYGYVCKTGGRLSKANAIGDRGQNQIIER